MDNSIRVAVDNLHGIAGKMQEIITSLENIENAINHIQSVTEPIWIGKTRDVYVKNCKTIAEDTKMLACEIRKNKNILEESMSEYEEGERDIDKQVSELSANDIFV